MREYSPYITVTRNERGIYSLDTIMGCSGGMRFGTRGCYGECYSAKSAKLYGYDFGKDVKRVFKDKAHQRQIISKINNIKLDFIRIGSSGDPSLDWEHTLNICKIISKANKKIVIITKHFNQLSQSQLEFLKTINVCINSSVSAMDNFCQMVKSLLQYERLKPYCESMLRVVSCDFNQQNARGKALNFIQDFLLKKDFVIDTVFRLNPNNKLAKDKVINVTQSKFLGKKCIISKHNPKTYFGKCGACLEMCGVAITGYNHNFQLRREIIKQTNLFTK